MTITGVKIKTDYAQKKLLNYILYKKYFVFRDLGKNIYQFSVIHKNAFFNCQFKKFFDQEVTNFTVTYSILHLYVSYQSRKK